MFLYLHPLENLILLGQIVGTALLQTLSPMLLTVVLHLGEQERLLLLGEPVLVVLLAAIATHQIDLQRVTDTAGLHIVVGIDIQPVIILGGADMRSEHLVRVEGQLHVELQQVIVLDDVLGKGDVL